jgi:hypothetical protein
MRQRRRKGDKLPPRVSQAPTKWVTLAKEDAEFWAQANKGTWRGDLWGMVASKARAVESRGRGTEIRFWASSDRAMLFNGRKHGLVEVVAI